MIKKTLHGPFKPYTVFRVHTLSLKLNSRTFKDLSTKNSRTFPGLFNEFGTEIAANQNLPRTHDALGLSMLYANFHVIKCMFRV